jgi:LAS superfamily LD-carboxypeptidase LdcB
MPARDCSPQTAIPGTSNHEKGIAVDIQEARSTGSAAYNWLVKNAATYGFYNDLNATKEPWHWSTTGR